MGKNKNRVWKYIKNNYQSIIWCVVLVLIVSAVVAHLVYSYTLDNHERLAYREKLVTLGGLLSSHKLDLIPFKNIEWDPIRHYYPVKQGEVLEIAYLIKNKSADKTLVIQEIQTSCGCLVSRDDLPLYIFPNDSNYIHIDFNTTKNTGYVSHYIDCYGNIDNSEHCAELLFDTHIVPPADYTHDYEEVWHEQGGVSASIEEFVNGKSSQKSYWLDKDTTSHTSK